MIFLHIPKFTFTSIVWRCMRYTLAGSILLIVSLFKTAQGSDIYKAILDRAMQRNTRTYLKGFQKFTVEHDALVKDVVENYKNEGLSHQFEIFKQLTKDVGIVEMGKQTFYSRAYMARRQIRLDLERNSRSPETWKLPLGNESGSSEALESNVSHDGAAEDETEAASPAIEENSRNHEGDYEKAVNEDCSDKRVEESEAYKMLLRNARMRKKHTFPPKGNQKYTSEHDTLVVDVVKTFNRDATVSRQFEIFKKLIEDLGMVQMSRGSFAERASAARRGNTRRSSRNVENATSNFLNSLFDENPKISESEALKALEAQPRDSNTFLPSFKKVRSWLKHRKAMRRFSDEEIGISNKRQKLEAPSSSLREPDDVGFWNEVSQALADDGAEVEST